jgi:hypothetical protein
MRALYLALPLLLAGAPPAIANASPVDGYVSQNAAAVCAGLDKAQDGGDVFMLTLAVARDGKFSVKDAANVIGRSAASSCPWNVPKVQQAGNHGASQ